MSEVNVTDTVVSGKREEKEQITGLQSTVYKQNMILNQTNSKAFNDTLV
jgi:hypothetical protein